MISFGRGKIANIIRKPVKKQKVYIFMICLFCSAVFWLFTRLSGEIRTEVVQPVRISDLPSDLMEVGQGINSVRYTLETTGSRFFTAFFSNRKDTIDIGFSLLRQMDDLTGETYFITARSLSAMIASFAGQGAVVSQVRPDTVFFSVTGKRSRMVQVKPRMDLTFERRFGLYGSVLLTPDSVLVTGPASIVDTLACIPTTRLDLQGLSQSFSGQLGLVLPTGSMAVTLEPNQVKVDVPVEEYTESQVEVPLSIHCVDSLNYVEAGKLRLYPNRVSLVFLVALPDYQKIDAKLFQAYVECPTTVFTGTQLQVHVGQVPDFVRMESIRPASVDFLIMN